MSFYSFLIILINIVNVLTLIRCRNGGIFVADGCYCSKDFEGLRCQYEKCAHGKRVSKYCNCDINWTGSLCQTPVCQYGTLHNNFCKCDKGYKGIFCQSVAKCINGDLFGTFRKNCICHKGWSGKFCDLIQCINGRRVTRTQCHCDPGYHAPHCGPLSHFQIDEACESKISGYVIALSILGSLLLAAICIFSIKKGYKAAQLQVSEDTLFNDNLPPIGRANERNFIDELPPSYDQAMMCVPEKVVRITSV